MRKPPSCAGKNADTAQAGVTAETPTCAPTLVSGRRSGHLLVLRASVQQLHDANLLGVLLHRVAAVGLDLGAVGVHCCHTQTQNIRTYTATKIKIRRNAIRIRDACGLKQLNRMLRMQETWNAQKKREHR